MSSALTIARKISLAFYFSGLSTGPASARQTAPLSDKASEFTRVPLKDRDANRSVVSDEICSNPPQTSNGVLDICSSIKKQVRINFIIRVL